MVRNHVFLGPRGWPKSVLQIHTLPATRKHLLHLKHRGGSCHLRCTHHVINGHDSALVIWQAPSKDIALSPVQFESRSRAQSRNAPDGCPCMHGQFHPELVGQHTANVDEIRERCL